MNTRLTALLCFTTISAFGSVALAEDCETDDDCAIGFACEGIGAVSCPPVESCPEGEDCPEPLPCDEVEVSECVPAPIECSGDEDCPSDLRCLSFTYEECRPSIVDVPGGRPSEDPGEAPTPGEPDPDDEGSDADEEGEPDHGEPDCETVTEAYCAPRYVGACETDEACGAGFTCVEEVECSRSSSGSSGSSGGGVPDPTPDVPGGGEESDPDEGEEDEGSEGEGFDPEGEGTEEELEEECFATGVFYCQPDEISCESDDECPTDWSCETSGGWVAIDCAPGEEDCSEETFEGESYCEPPYWDVWSGAFHDDADLAAGSARADGESATPAFDVPNTSRGEAGSGCTVATGSRPGSGLVLLALGLMGLRRRR